MGSFGQVLVATDLSPRADLAVSRAWQIASQHRAAFTALHVVEPIGEFVVLPGAWKRLAKTPEEVAEALRQSAEEELRRQLDRGPHPAPPSVQVRARVGNPLSVIVEEARARVADLVVIGAHGRHFLRDLLLGTTAEGVVRGSVCPVLVVRKRPVHRYRRILAAVDFSDTSRRALALARRMSPQAKLLVMHAYEISYEGHLGAGGTASAQLLRLHREYERMLGQRLHAFVADAGIDPEAVTRLVRHGYPGVTVVRAVVDLRADLVVLGARGTSALGHLFLGSVAKHALREARSDVAMCP